MVQRVLLVGGTGLVGGHVAERLRASPDIVLLTSLVRQKRQSFDRVMDFDALCLEPSQAIITIVPDGVDVAISCLGTTMRKAGSREAMWKVDHDYVVALATGARAAGATQFILVSAAGAGGAGFYLKTKGAVEDAVGKLGFSRVDIIRPGLLLGNRNERRFGEELGQYIFPFLRPLLSGPFAQYQGIPATLVAEAIVRLIGIKAPGIHVHRNTDLRALTFE